MTKRLRYTTFGLFIILIGLILYFIPLDDIFTSQETPSPTPEIQAEPEAKTANIIIDFGDENSISNEVVIEEETSVFDLLENTTQKEGMSIETQEYDFGIFVKSIGGFESSTEMAWIYFVNGKSGQVAADQYIVQPEDEVEWKYIAPKNQ